MISSPVDAAQRARQVARRDAGRDIDRGAIGLAPRGRQGALMSATMSPIAPFRP
jgi:hypothetical protein